MYNEECKTYDREENNSSNACNFSAINKEVNNVNLSPFGTNNGNLTVYNEDVELCGRNLSTIYETDEFSSDNEE